MPSRLVSSLSVLSAALLLAACASTSKPAGQSTLTHKTDEPESLYSQLKYWPMYDQTGVDDNSCVPESWLSIFSEPEQPTDLWGQVVSGYGFDQPVKEANISKQLEIYDGNQELFDIVSGRAANYMHYVVEQLDERDMPMELALLPIVESGYNPKAVSRASAVGMWQFIPGTGKRYGLEQNYWYDARKDVLASTDAALDYLQTLNEEFEGDWFLTLAAYNAGENRVRREVERNRRAGKPTDYWSLSLPRETRNYVPRLLAVSRILEQPEEFGIELNPIPLETAFTEVTVEKPVDLSGVIARAGLDQDQFYTLNPAFRTSYTPPKTSCRLLIPADARDDFVAVLNAVPESVVYPPSKYTIKRGDTLSTIARRHHTTARAIRDVNGMSSNFIRAGDTLVIPNSEIGAPVSVVAEAKSKAASTDLYIVRPGDNLRTIARRAGTSTSRLIALNNLDPNVPLKIGQTLQLSTSEVSNIDPTPASKRKIQYRVIRGDSIAAIASRFKVNYKDVMRWNGINANRPLIKPGQIILIYVDPDHETVQVASAEE